MLIMAMLGITLLRLKKFLLHSTIMNINGIFNVPSQDYVVTIQYSNYVATIKCLHGDCSNYAVTVVTMR